MLKIVNVLYLFITRNNNQIIFNIQRNENIKNTKNFNIISTIKIKHWIKLLRISVIQEN